MLAISILTISGLFIGYNMGLRILPAVRFKRYDRIERCEEYVYHGNYDKVFTGSGLIGELDNFLPDRSFNLCFPYFGSCTGLEIIARSGKVPKVVYIETNYVFKGLDKELIGRIFEKQNRKLRHIAPVFLRKNQPVSLLKSAWRQISGSRAREQAKAEDGPFDQKELDRYRRIYNEPFDKQQLEDTLLLLEKQVNHIGAQGCQVVFFEMPVHETLYHAGLYEQQRNTLKEIFNKGDFVWIEPGQFHDYQTVDGIHLTQESMERYAGFLMQNTRTLLT